MTRDARPDAMHGIDVVAARAATPGCAGIAYFNNAAVSLMPQAVVEAVTGHLHAEARIGAYNAAADRAGDLSDGYEAAAMLLGCDTDEIAFTGSNTCGWEAFVGTLTFSRGDVILTGEAEWGGNYAALLHIAARTGARVEIVPSDADGTISIDALKTMADARTRLIALTWAPSGNGLINPAAEVGAIARATGIPYIIDAAQMVGQLPVDVRALQCDALTAPGRKWLRGPRGTGLLYVRADYNRQHQPAFVDYLSAPFGPDGFALRPDARRFETAEAAVALRLGLGCAIRQHLAIGTDAIAARIDRLAGRLRRDLSAIAGVVVQDRGLHRSGIVTFTLDGVAAGVVQYDLKRAGIEVTVSPRGFTPLAFVRWQLDEVVRISPHYYNTDAELDRLIGEVAAIAARRASA